jgi:BirA family biotin operon repressor/biotin-[acetyl-CoA-carboxylase] ligase
MNDSIDVAELNSTLENTIFAGKISVFPTIGSTSSFAMQEAANGAPHGSVYIAEEQTAGRGRGAHTWHSESGSGVYMSILVRPRMTPADALWLSLSTGLAVQRAIENVTAMVADIRWPNDLLLDGRKFCGILTEMNAEATQVRYAVTGIGVNVNHGSFPAELRGVATSLRIESARIAARQEVAAAILEAVDAEWRELLDPLNFSRTTASILERLERRSTWARGKHVFVDESGGYTGVTAGLDARGFLRVDTGSGIRTVLSGGVRECSSKD